MLGLYLGPLIFFLNFFLTAEDKLFNIGFIDYKSDIRYSDWGVHPVDIRSKKNKELRPLDGAKLAVLEANKLKRITKTKVALNHLRVDSEKSLYNLMNSEDIKKHHAILLDIPIKKFGKIKEILKKNSSIIFFNISNESNSLRANLCFENLFHSFPSNMMKTDSIAQFLVQKKWNKTLMLTGSLEQDKNLAKSFRQSAKKFGIKILKENYFVNSNDPRNREKNNLSFLTKGKKYNSIFIADVDGEFSLTVTNNTVSVASVVGSSGLIPLAWHWSYLRHGAPQVNGRFEREFDRRMNERDWSAWVAVKSITESILRTKSIQTEDIKKYLITNNFKVDGSKGISLNYRPDTKQLRQTIFLVSGGNWVTNVAPLENFQSRENNLDTIGIVKENNKCKDNNI